MRPILILAFFLLTPSLAAQAKQLTFGIVPQQSAITLASNWGPILKYLSQHTGEEVVFRTAKDIPEFEKRLLNDEYDIAYMNPYHYTVFQQKPGYRAFAKQKDKRIRGIVVVSKASPIQSLDELDGEELAFPSPAAFAASVVPRSAMAQQNIGVTPKYVSSHDSVYLNVAKGFFKAGGGIERTLNNTNPEVRDGLRILWRTDGYTPHAFAVSPRVSQQTLEKIQMALLSLNEHNEGKALLKGISFAGVEAAEDSDWDDVRALNITLLSHLLTE